ncbi:MAG TPA: methyltransferase domain-containing protein [Chryseosolibacter sp.]|nr:methyltransferase domain-containing protein [Chryseosolibacter sp.]
MPDFSKRSGEIEMMDDLRSGGEVIEVTLKELEKINLLLGGNHVTIDGVRKLLRQKPGREILIADVGCGSGDILKLLRRLLLKKSMQADLIGIDANPNVVEYAVRNTAGESGIRFEALDIFSDAFRERTFDIVTGTLFFHHFTDEQLVHFFTMLKDKVRIGIVINDIHRHWFAYYSIKWLTGLLSKSEMVRNDAPVSVMRAFKKRELETILRRAGFANFTIRWMWAFRWQVVIEVAK